eukprot:COSAG04_NODE_17313_length_472_cov_2.418231_2_plen_77_part_00
MKSEMRKMGTSSTFFWVYDSSACKEQKKKRKPEHENMRPGHGRSGVQLRSDSRASLVPYQVLLPQRGNRRADALGR